MFKYVALAAVVSVLSFSTANAQDCDHAAKAKTVTYIDDFAVQETEKQPVVAAQECNSAQECNQRTPLRNVAKRIRGAQPVRTIVRGAARTTVRVATLPFRMVRVMVQERPIRSRMRARWAARCSSCEK